MTTPRLTTRRPAAGALVDVAPVQARLPRRAAAARRRRSAGAARRAARRAARAVAQAPRRRRARTTSAPRLLRRRPLGLGAVGHGDVVPADGHARARAAPLPRPGHHRARVARRPPAGVGRHHRAPRAPRATSTASRCCATRSSCSTTCTCRCSRLPAGSCGSASRVGAARRRSTRRWRCSRLRAADGAHRRPGGPASSARAEERAAAAEPPGAPPVRRSPPPRRPARRCASPASATALVARAPGGVGALVRAGRRAARWRRAAWHALAWAVFGAAYVGAVVFVAIGARRRGRATCCSCSPPAPAVGVHRRDGRRDRLPARHLAGRLAAARLARGLRRGRSTPHADAPVPDRLDDGIRFDHVSFAYPGTDRLVLDDVDLRCRPGAVVAIVGENGAGKTTLVKLLCQLYEPDQRPRSSSTASTSARMPRRRLARAAGRRVPGLLPLRVRAPPRRSASATCPASTTSPRSAPPSTGPAPTTSSTGLADGLDTQLGPTWPGGRRGQLRPVAEARAGPRLHARRPAAARARRADRGARRRDRARAVRALRRRRAAAGQPTTGGITILVSHRFSTVRMADLIVVLDGARVVEVGTHDELMARRGTYAELYGIQAASYASSRGEQDVLVLTDEEITRMEQAESRELTSSADPAADGRRPGHDDVPGSRPGGAWASRAQAPYSSCRGSSTSRSRCRGCTGCPTGTSCGSASRASGWRLLLATFWLHRQRRILGILTAFATGVVLLCDASFDLLTSAPGSSGRRCSRPSSSRSRSP